MLGKNKQTDQAEPTTQEGDLEILDATDLDDLAAGDAKEANPLTHLSSLEEQLRESLQGGLKNVEAEWGKAMAEMNANLEAVQGALETEKAAHEREKGNREALEAQVQHHEARLAEARSKLVELRHDLETAREELTAASKRQATLNAHLEMSEERFASLSSLLGESEGDLGLDVPEVPVADVEAEDGATFEIVEPGQA